MKLERIENSKLLLLNFTERIFLCSLNLGLSVESQTLFLLIKSNSRLRTQTAHRALPCLRKMKNKKVPTRLET
jgi:hypothetical protein